jgi:hypothetical protein
MAPGRPSVLISAGPYSDTCGYCHVGQSAKHGAAALCAAAYAGLGTPTHAVDDTSLLPGVHAQHLLPGDYDGGGRGRRPCTHTHTHTHTRMLTAGVGARHRLDRPQLAPFWQLPLLGGQHRQLLRAACDPVHAPALSPGAVTAMAAGRLTYACGVRVVQTGPGALPADQGPAACAAAHARVPPRQLGAWRAACRRPPAHRYGPRGPRDSGMGGGACHAAGARAWRDGSQGDGRARGSGWRLAAAGSAGLSHTGAPAACSARRHSAGMGGEQRVLCAGGRGGARRQWHARRMDPCACWPAAAAGAWAPDRTRGCSGPGQCPRPCSGSGDGPGPGRAGAVWARQPRRPARGRAPTARCYKRPCARGTCTGGCPHRQAAHLGGTCGAGGV